MILNVILNIQFQNQFRFDIQRNKKSTIFKISFKKQLFISKNANFDKQIFFIEFSKNSLIATNFKRRFKHKRVLTNSNDDEIEFKNDTFIKSNINISIDFHNFS